MRNRVVLLEKLTVGQPLKKALAIAETGRFFKMFTRAHHWALS
jgi:hypothetical protein